MIYVVWTLGYVYLLLWAAELAHFQLKARDLLAQIRAQHARVNARMDEAIAYRRRQIDTSSETLQYLLRLTLRHSHKEMLQRQHLLKLVQRQAHKETIRRQRDAKRRYKRKPPPSASGLAEALRYQDAITKELP